MEPENGLPIWLTGAIEGIDTTPLPEPLSVEWPVHARAGDVRAAVPMDPNEEPARLVVVIETHEAPTVPWVTALLIARDPDVCTDRDIRLDAEETGLPFPVLVQSDIVGSLFAAQLGPSLAQLSEDLVRHFKQALHGNMGPFARDRRGLPTTSPSDARWRLKEEEIEVIHELGRECLTELLDGIERPQLVIVDDDLWSDPEDVNERTERLLELVDVQSSGPTELRVPLEAVMDGGRLREWLAQLEPDQWTALMPVLESALNTEAPSPGAGEVRWQPSRAPSDSDALERHVAAAARDGRRVITVATGKSAWRTADQDLAAGVLSADVAGLGRVLARPLVLERVA